jgi:ADP-ribose pyrophosphatase YjhB (NUDIX family)
MTTTPASCFAYCPRCGGRVASPTATDPFDCSHCGFVLFLNVAVSVAALIVRADGKGLFIRRAKEPAKGAWALAGGFVDPGETLEAALVREVREEVGLELASLEYLGSHRNDYPYRGVVYPVADTLFAAKVNGMPEAAALEDVAAVAWLDPAALDPAELAFESMRHALALYLARARPTRDE